MKMKETFVITFLTAGLVIFLFLLFGAHAKPTPTSPTPAVTPSEQTATTIFALTNVTNETGAGEKKERSDNVALEANSSNSSHLELPPKNDTGHLQTIPTEITAKLSTDGQHSVQKIGDRETGNSTNVKQFIEKNSVAEDTKLKRIISTPAPLTDEDKKIRQAWGGTCTLAIWNVCNRIKSWGGDYLVPDKNNPENMIKKYYRVDCVEKPDKTFCLKNGWTVARCHMLCMSQCNIEYRQNYDKLVDHEAGTVQFIAMNPRNTSIFSILLLIVLLNTSPSADACLKKIRTLIKSKNEEKPAELARDEAAYIKYAHSSRDSVYIEIIQNENKTFVVRDLEHPPIAMSQVRGSEGKAMNVEEPDAEYINLNETTNGVNNSIPTSSEAIPPVRTPPEVSPTKEVAEATLSPEDATIRHEWGGNCTVSDWNRCNKIRQIVVIDVINNQWERKNMELDCLIEPVLCLRNGWTANRCHIICMAAQCNKSLFYDWDGIVNFEGKCRYFE
ncbi:unnamed protein product [Orchesella dallaii]|uniref:Uncharacterized protein n=1 Tax=Orchesella dallaii TaxID=48710 RepID=A0ABP1QB52_9HEXA